MLEETSWTPSYGCSGAALDDAKRSNMSGFSTDVSILSKETLSAENNLKGSQLKNSSLTESNLTNVGNGLRVKGSDELLFYSWPDLGNFEDVDDILRNCDSTFGLDLDNSDDFSWSFPSSQTIEGSTDILTSSFDFPSCNSCDPAVTRQQEVYGQSSNGMAVNDTHKERMLANCKRDSVKSISDSPQIGTQLEIHSHISPAKHQKSSERKRKDRSSENGISLIQFDKLCEAEELNHLLNSQHSFSPENHQQLEISPKSCLETSMPMIKPNNSHPSDHVLPGSTSIIKSEVTVLPTKSPRKASHASNQTHSFASSHDVSSKNVTCSENKKKGKSHRHRSSRYTEKSSILVRRVESEILCAENQTPCGENDAEGQSEVYGSDIHFTGELGSSTKQSSSCMSSVLDNISIDACSLKQLQHVMLQLDRSTKLCIRNSLYRLARSAAQRLNCVNTSRAEGESKDPIGALLSNETNKCTGFTDIETDTNPIDRSIAHLLFHRPADPLAASAPVAAMTVKSRTMEYQDEELTVRNKVLPQTSLNH